MAPQGQNHVKDQVCLGCKRNGLGKNPSLCWYGNLIASRGVWGISVVHQMCC
jgi:hypothetical protein